MNNFLSTLTDLSGQVKSFSQNCKKENPTRGQLVALKAKLQNAKGYLSSFGAQGNLDLVKDCAVYSLLPPKDELPTTALGWASWLRGLEGTIDQAIANAPSDTPINANVAIDRANTSANTSVNIATNMANQESFPYQTEIVEYVQPVVSWWSTPLLTVKGLDITPTRVAIGFGVYMLMRNMQRGRR